MTKEATDPRLGANRSMMIRVLRVACGFGILRLITDDDGCLRWRLGGREKARVYERVSFGVSFYFFDGFRLAVVVSRLGRDSWERGGR